MNEVAEAVYDDITVSGNADEGDTAPSAAPVVVEQAIEADDDAEPVEESEATKAAKTLAAQRKKNDPAKDPAAKKQSIQAQIDADTARKHAAKREADAEAARLETLRQERAKLEAPAAAKAEPAADPSKPKRKDFVDAIGSTYETYEDAQDAYDEARDAWRETKRADDAQRTAMQAMQRDVAVKAQARIDAFKAEHADYDDIVSKAFIPPGSQSGHAVIEHLNHSELGPQLAYALAQDPAELARIAGLPYGFAIAALGRLEAKLDTRAEAADAGPAPKAPDYKPAKPPIKPVGSSPVTSDADGDPDDLSEAAVAAHVRRENAKDLARRRR